MTGPGRPLLNEFWTNHALAPGLETWHGQEPTGNEQDKVPFVGINTSGSDVSVPHRLARRRFACAPGFFGGRSDQMGQPDGRFIRVRSAVIDRDNNCGDGVNWSIWMSNQPPIAKGNFSDGGEARVRSANITWIRALASSSASA